MFRHTERPVETDRFLQRLRELTQYHDAPVATVSYYAHWSLMELIAEAGYRVAVSGTGADEIFSGYYDHHLFYLQELAAEPVRARAALRRVASPCAPPRSQPAASRPRSFVRTPEFRDHLYAAVSRASSSSRGRTRSSSGISDSLLRNRMLNELMDEVVPVILHEDDLNAMYYSVENRAPYLDRPLVEFCNTIPTRHLLRDGYAKAILRDAARGIAPDHVVDNRRKVGFNAPIFDFLDRHDPEVRELLRDSPIFDVVRRERIVDLLDEPDLSNSLSKFLFSFVTGKMFLEEFPP